MQNLSKISILAIALLCLLTTAALAERTPIATQLDETGVKEFRAGPSPLPGAVVPCQVGNLNPAAWAISGWALPPEVYALMFDPAANCANCALGFQVNTVHMFLQTNGACTIDVGVALMGADFTDPACPFPAGTACSSSYFTVNLPQAGLWDIALPIDCPCADPGYTYALLVDFLSASCVPDLITDNFPTGCTSWNNWGAGWVDLVSGPGFPGELIMFADATCCEPAVGAEESSWGRIKGLFHQE